MAALLAALPVNAQEQQQIPQCAEYRVYVDLLGRAGEQNLIDLESDNGGLFEVWLSMETGTWTLLHVFDPTNRSACIRAHGAGYAIPLGEPDPRARFRP